MPTYQQHLKALQRAREAGDEEAVAYIRAEAIKADQEETRAAFKRDEAARPFAERALTNLGAGFDSAWQGAKQLVGKGPSDEELAEKRRRDAELAEGTRGGGLIQLAGEIAPAVVGGGGVGVAARALPAAVQAGRGMQVASKVLSKAPVRGALEGAGAAALMPTMSDESRLANVALGGAGGAAAPYVLKGAVAAGRGLKHGAQRVAAAGGQNNAAKAVAGRRLGKELTEQGIDDAALATPVYVPHPNLPTQPSAAVTYQNPKLASMELGSRNASRDLWVPHDTANQAARWQHLDEGLQKQADVDRLLGEANQIGASVPYEATGPRLFKREFDDFYGKLQQAKGTAQYQGNPAVRSAVDYIERTIADAGEVTPQLVHQMKQTLSRGLTGAPGAGEAGVRAASSEPFVISLAGALDDVLGQSSKGGKWGKWKSEYGEQMTKAEAAKADVNIRNKFVDEATGTLKKSQIGPMNPGEPVVTGHALKQAVAAAGSAKRGPRKGQELLSKRSKEALRNVEQDLDANAIFQRVKASSTGGGGSDTAPNLLTAMAIESLMPTGLGIGAWVKGASNRNISEVQKRALAELLQDPQKLRAFVLQQQLRQQAQRQLPNNMIARGAGTALLPAME